MKRKIVILISMVFFIVSSYAMMPFTETDFLTYRQREKIIANQIAKCKDVANVQVNEHGEESSEATITVFLNNGRSLVLETSGIHLKFEEIFIMKIDSFVPVVLSYKSSQYKTNERRISLGLSHLQASQIKYLDKNLESINDISTIIENFELIYDIFSNLPEADEDFPKFSYKDTSENEISCLTWEQMENPHFYKTETEGGKFYKMTEEAFEKYYSF